MNKRLKKKYGLIVTKKQLCGHCNGFTLMKQIDGIQCCSLCSNPYYTDHTCNNCRLELDTMGDDYNYYCKYSRFCFKLRKAKDFAVCEECKSLKKTTIGIRNYRRDYGGSIECGGMYAYEWTSIHSCPRCGEITETDDSSY